MNWKEIQEEEKRALIILTRAGLIFLCSSFEVYVESITYETGNFITRKIYQPKKLPMEARKTISDAVKKKKMYFANFILR